MRRRLFALAKEAGQRGDDVCAANRLAGRYALCDGASACYAGGAWARLLSRRYVRDPDLDIDWLACARAAFASVARPDAADWLGQIAFGRGSFTTLLGFTLFADRIDGIAIGDTVLFVQSGGDFIHVPPMAVGDFAANPVLLSTHPGRGALADTDGAFQNAAFTMPAPEGGWQGTRLLAMTDALAAWTLGDPLPRLARLAALRAKPEFSTLIAEETAAGALRRDDATLLMLEP